MKITRLELIPVFSTREMGKTCPSDSEKAVSQHVIVFLHTDADIIGLGEMSDVNFDPTPKVVGELQARLEPLLVGRSPFDRTAILVDLCRQEWDHQVKCAIEISIYDAMGKALDLPVHQLLGGKYRDRIPFAYPLAAARTEPDVDSNLARVERLLEQGHSTIRYYFGVNLDEDDRFLTELRRRWGNDVLINALDMSGRFEVEEGIEVIKRFAHYEPNLFESPVNGRHFAPPEDFLRVKGAVDVPISEHVGSTEIGVRLARNNAVDVFNVGVDWDGITECIKIFALGEMFGIKVLHGSTVELSIGTAARAHLLAAMPNVDLPCYPAGPLVYQEQVVKEKVRYKDGHIVVPDGPGLGVEIDVERLATQRL
jgi:muconate cycloisomerase